MLGADRCPVAAAAAAALCRHAAPAGGITGGFAGGERGLQQYVEKGDLQISTERQGQFSPLLVAGFVASVVTVVALLVNQGEDAAEAQVRPAAAGGAQGTQSPAAAEHVGVQIDTKLLGQSVSGLRIASYSPAQRLVLTVAAGLLGLSLTVGGAAPLTCVSQGRLPGMPCAGQSLASSVCHPSCTPPQALTLSRPGNACTPCSTELMVLACRSTLCGQAPAVRRSRGQGCRRADSRVCRLPGCGGAGCQGGLPQSSLRCGSQNAAVCTRDRAHLPACAGYPGLPVALVCSSSRAATHQLLKAANFGQMEQVPLSPGLYEPRLQLKEKQHGVTRRPPPGASVMTGSCS